jgi:NADPH-dependent 2,4-dienoyl-CoA reductase/sulfur reductase-like enzyme
MIDPIKTAYIAGFMANTEWDNDDERIYWEKEAIKTYEALVFINWYGVGDAIDIVNGPTLQKARDEFVPTKESVDRLRKLTGAGFYQCKEALINCLGDEEQCVNYLRLMGTTKFTDYYRELSNRQRRILLGEKIYE